MKKITKLLIIVLLWFLSIWPSFILAASYTQTQSCNCDACVKDETNLWIKWIRDKYNSIKNKKDKKKYYNQVIESWYWKKALWDNQSYKIPNINTNFKETCDNSINKKTEQKETKKEDSKKENIAINDHNECWVIASKVSRAWWSKWQIASAIQECENKIYLNKEASIKTDTAKQKLWNNDNEIFLIKNQLNDIIKNDPNAWYDSCSNISYSKNISVKDFEVLCKNTIDEYKYFYNKLKLDNNWNTSKKVTNSFISDWVWYLDKANSKWFLD